MQRLGFFSVICCLLAGSAAWPGAAQGSVAVTVQGDRVNLRARPDEQSEVVGQVNTGDRLVARSFDEEWAEVIPPPSVILWVHRDFVADGRVQTRLLNVRAGPGINFNVQGTLEQNDAVEVKDTFGEWLGIAPPPSCSLWIARKYVAHETRAAPRATEPAPRAAPSSPRPPRDPMPEPTPPVVRKPLPSPAVVDEGPATPAEQRPAERAGPEPQWRLVPLQGQGRLVEREGVLSRVGFALRRPSRFRLLHEEGSGYRPLCFVHGDKRLLNRYVREEVIISGREYWLRDTPYPVLVVEQIVPRVKPRAVP